MRRRGEMELRTHKNLKEIRNDDGFENKKFKYYKGLCEHITSDKKLNERYERELIDYLEKDSGLELCDLVKSIERDNPYENGFVIREDFRKKDRETLEKQELVKNKFCEKSSQSKVNDLEPMIQRNIILSGQYNDILGMPIYYEFPCNKGDKRPIDLITYDKNSNMVYLVELKKCSASEREKIENNDEKESEELFLRAAFEISTYYSFFTHLIQNSKEDCARVEEAFYYVSGQKIDLHSSKTKIKKAILAPKRLFEDVYTDKLKKLMKEYECFWIERKSNIETLKDYTINTKEQLFNIKRI